MYLARNPPFYFMAKVFCKNFKKEPLPEFAVNLVMKLFISNWSFE